MRTAATARCITERATLASTWPRCRRWRGMPRPPPRPAMTAGIGEFSAGLPSCSRCPTRCRRIDRKEFEGPLVGPLDDQGPTPRWAIQRVDMAQQGEAVDIWRLEVKRLVLVFSKEKETKGTYRYQELGVAERDTAVGSLYLKKAVVGDPPSAQLRGDNRGEPWSGGLTSWRKATRVLPVSVKLSTAPPPVVAGPSSVSRRTARGASSAACTTGTGRPARRTAPAPRPGSGTGSPPALAAPRSAPASSRRRRA
jgi:hypothetical protein